MKNVSSVGIYKFKWKKLYLVTRKSHRINVPNTISITENLKIKRKPFINRIAEPEDIFKASVKIHPILFRAT